MNEDDAFRTMESAWGLYVAQLTLEERNAFDYLYSIGKAKREYSSVAGFLGLPKAVRIK